jgi:hypothetical protein
MRSHASYFFGKVLRLGAASSSAGGCIAGPAYVAIFSFFFLPGGLLHKQGPPSGRSAPALAQRTGGNLLLLAGGPSEGAGGPSQHQAPTSVQ